MVRSVKRIIFNPVLEIPWQPRCYSKCSRLSGIADQQNVALNLKKDIIPEDLTIRKVRGAYRGSPKVKVSKAALTKYYADELSPKYTLLTKTQIKAALTLNDNNIHETCVMLDIKSKFENLKKNQHLPIKKRVTIVSPIRIEQNEEDAPVLPAETVAEPVPKLGMFPKVKGITPAAKLDESSSSTVTITNSFAYSSSVYDFRDSDFDHEPIQQWKYVREELDKKATLPLSPMKKIGVIIIKQKEGYKSYLL